MQAPNTLSQVILAALMLGAVSAINAEVRTYRNPMYQGYRLDYCQAFGQVCGERVATQWCRNQGFEYASDWAIDRGIGDIQPTSRLDDDNVCRGHQCDGFVDITCGREGRSFRLPNLGAITRATVFTPDRTGTAPALMPVEVQLLVPGCHQWEPGILQCETVYDYQHCRTLLGDGKVLGCRAGLAFDGAFAQPRAASPGTYDLSLRSRVRATVHENRRGDGRLKGEARYEVEFDIPEYGAAGGTCLQRDRYVYHPTGPKGGLSTIDETADCDEPIEGRFAANEDDLLRAFDYCDARHAWGSKIEITTDLMVAGLFHFVSPTASEVPEPGSSTIIAPYLTLYAPMIVDCKD